MKNDLFMDIVGSITCILIITGGVMSIVNGELILGWVYTTCGIGIALICGHHMWRRYK